VNIKITFEINELPMFSLSHKNGRKTFEIEALDGVLTVGVKYDFDRRALLLNSEIKLYDKVEVILLDHRIELYVNGELKDEEWPLGNRLFEKGDSFTPDISVSVSEYEEKKEELPAVISSFENAEGWRPSGEVFVGDCMPYRRGNEYHVLYLKDRHHHSSKWGLGAHQWEHISTVDFNRWDIHPMAVAITDPAECSICTGSWIKKGGTEYLYYTVRRKGAPAPIRRSISKDGYHFEKDEGFGFTLSERYSKGSARDPKVVLSEDGRYHMFLTTSLAEENRGCLAHYVSSDLENWEDYGEPIYVSEDSRQPECPDYFKYRGKYYLVFSLSGKAHYMISDKPFEGFSLPKDPVIPCESVPKCAEWEDRLVFCGFKKIGGYAGTMTFKAARADKDGTLIFEDL
jgi:hypothetical protein